MSSETIPVLLFGFAFGIGVMLLSGLGFQSWQEGGKLQARLKSVEKENKERLTKARQDVSRGRRKRLSGLVWFFLAAGLLVFFLFYAGIF